MRTEEDTHVLKEHVFRREGDRRNNKFIWVVWWWWWWWWGWMVNPYECMLPFYFSSIIYVECNAFLCCYYQMYSSQKPDIQIKYMNITNQFNSFKNILFTLLSFQIFSFDRMMIVMACNAWFFFWFSWG